MHSRHCRCHQCFDGARAQGRQGLLHWGRYEWQVGILLSYIHTQIKRCCGSLADHVGARLGVLDASEIPPTYSAPEDQFVALIAGGDYALRKAREGAEDSRSNAATDLQPLRLDPDVDSLIGIASSGRTPYVLGGLEYAKSLGCLTVGIVCVEPSAVGREGNVDFLIAPVTGPEVVTGSTRMKAGTATKLVLNMISTGIMIGIGKTYGNLVSPQSGRSCVRRMQSTYTGTCR